MKPQRQAPIRTFYFAVGLPATETKKEIVCATGVINVVPCENLDAVRVTTAGIDPQKFADEHCGLVTDTEEEMREELGFWG